jgi:DNA-binding transcriptional regulator YiaG
MAELTKKLLQDVKAWCDQERGRKAGLARMFGISPQSVSNWFAGVQDLTGEQALALQALLQRETGKPSAGEPPPAERKGTRKRKSG